MLTIQQILESDSISSLVAKLNANFQTIAASNGGPQGIRGAQGIPGLPGKLGPTGPTGATGPTGTILGIIPFACIPGTGPTAIGPSGTIVTPYGTVGPWPQSSWQWLQYYHVTGAQGDIFIDHANDGYWQYLNAPDVQGACDGAGGYTSGGYYSYQGTGAAYPYLGSTGGWAGAGWYFYPVPESVDSSTVWISDNTTYLATSPTGPYAQGPYEDTNTSPLTVKNARLLSKYGTIWVSSGSDENNPASYEDSDLNTPTIGEWGHDPAGLLYPNPGRVNSGIDRLLFKMSLDGLPYLSNITARGYTGVIGPDAGNPFPMQPNSIYPDDSGTQMLGASYWANPAYDVSFEKYTPLLFLSERRLEDADPDIKFSSLGIYMFTAVGEGAEDNQNKSIFLFSTRYSPDPTQMYDPLFTPPLDSVDTENWGELMLDFRRITASNQYVCSVPADLRLSSDYIGDYSGNSTYDESNSDNVDNLDFAYRTYQGYISSINGKTLTGEGQYAAYWEYGLGDGVPGGAGGYTGGIHDAASGTAGMSTRKSWYGSSVLDSDPSDWTNTQAAIDQYNLIRVAGMMERGRRFKDEEDKTHFLSELIFYTSQFRTPTIDLEYEAGLTNSQVDPTINAHKSLPSLYVSPYRNIGIGTFVGDADAVNDLGPLEPAARLHVHAKENLRENDPTFTWNDLGVGTGLSSYLPNETFTVAAFSGDFGASNNQYNTDILIGNLRSQSVEYVNPATSYASGDVVNHMQEQAGSTGYNFLRNAIRTESWRGSDTYVNTLRFGAQPGVIYTGADPVKNPIGKNSLGSYKNEFQLTIHPLTTDSTSTELEDSNRSISGVGIHNLYPRTRLHIYGKNAYNEAEFGEELWTPGYTIAGGSATGISGTYPFYGSTAQNSPSTSQVAIDYIGDTYRYPVGIYDYQYFTIGLTASTSSSSLVSISPNAAVYPTRESLSPTRTFAPWPAGAASNEAWPSTNPAVTVNGAYRHGGTANAWWEAASYIGFNIFRDVSAADGNNNGDNRDTTRWVLGTDGDNDYERGNNGAAAIISSPYGEIGLVTIPRGRDGGYAYEQWEQRGLGTRDVLNQMKIVFDRNGNIAVGNAAGWDLDAYPSLDRFTDTGYLRYTPATSKETNPGTTAGAGTSYAYAYYSGTGAYGLIDYGVSYPETPADSPAAKINANATEKEYIRLEVAAEKAWSRNGRSIAQNGYGYPPNATLLVATPINYIKFTAPITGITSWQLTTDDEGRIVDSRITFTKSGTVTSTNFAVIVYPHPTEFNNGGPQTYPGYTAPAGALAAEWSGMNRDSGSVKGITMVLGATIAILINTADERGDANLRLNNFVYGEGFGISGQGATGGALPGGLGNYSYEKVKEHRQKSPKLIFTFLEKNPDSSRPGSLTEPYKKVNTVVQSAQNESPLREYFIPKSDNTGGTFMVFTDHMGSKEHEDGIDRQLTSGTGYTGGNGGGGTTGGNTATGNIEKLILTQVVTAEMVYGRTGASSPYITSLAGVTAGLSGGEVSEDNPKALNYVLYYNKYQKNRGAIGNPASGLTAAFTSAQYAQVLPISNYESDFAALGATGSFTSFEGTGTNVNTTYRRAAARRNIDHFYRIFQGTKADYADETSAIGWQSKATEIRFKRINSEFAFVDFNITVEVDNPQFDSPSGAYIRFSDLDAYLDFGVPRMTQSLSFIYNPDFDESRNDFTQDEYGNGPWFHMWSGYRNWLPGSAVVGGDINEDTLNTSTSVPGLPGDSAIDAPSFRANPFSWSGNILGAATFDWSPNGTSSEFYSSSNYAFTNIDEFGVTPAPAQSFIHHGSNRNVINAKISKDLFGLISTGATGAAALGFMYHLPAYVGAWGVQTMSRTKNFSWRMRPTRWQETTASAGNLTNNAFELEIMFNEPIMHVSHKFDSKNFGVTNPYKYLTLSGQGIIQYGETDYTKK